jgi:UPF0716 protein FxsA
MPFAFLFLIFIFLEIAGFVAMANAIGLLGVFGLIILGFVAGGFIIRTMGVASVQRMQRRAEAGETVGQELGGLVLGFLGGVLLILPGFFTDLLGIALLIKPIQMLIWPRYGSRVASGMPQFRGPQASNDDWQSPGHQPQASPDNVVIDAEPAVEGPSEGSSKPGRERDHNPWG